MRTKKTDNTDGVNPVWRERMKQLRGEYTYRQAASLIGISPQNWYVYENGPSTPGTKVVLKMCQTFGVSADWLLGLSDVRTPVKEAAPPVATPPAAPATTAAKRPKNSPGAKYPDPNAALLAEVRELTARVKALEAAASKPAFACG